MHGATMKIVLEVTITFPFFVHATCVTYINFLRYCLGQLRLIALFMPATTSVLVGQSGMRCEFHISVF